MSEVQPIGSEEPSHLAKRLKSLPPDKLIRVRQQAGSTKLSGHSLVAETLRACGIRRIYGVSGTPVDSIFGECAKRGIRSISPANQQCAVLMAAAGNYVAGRMEAAVVVSAGPGVTNTLTAIHAARENGWPVIVLGGRRAVEREGIGYFQELDGVSLLAPFTKLARTVRRTSEISETIIEAFEAAQSGRPGPVFIDLPEDVLETFDHASQIRVPRFSPSPVVEREILRQISRTVTEARRPLLVLGEDIRWSLDIKTLASLVEDFGIPFITAPLARGYLPDDHSLSANDVRRWSQRQADVVIMAGTWFDWRFRFGTELAPDAQVIHASSDAVTLGKNVRDGINILCDPGLFLSDLYKALSGDRNERSGQHLSEWHVQLAAARAEHDHSCEAWLVQKSEYLLPQQLYSALRDLIPNDSIVAVEGNICLAAAQKILRVGRPASWLDPGRNGIIGGCIACAMGAKLAEPQRHVVALCSDTGFLMSAMELECAVRHHIPIIVVIANNDGNSGAVRQNMFFPPGYPERVTQFLPGLRYEQIMEVFGGHAEYITEAAQIRPAFERAIQSGSPACLNVRIDPDAGHSGIW